MVTHTVPCLYAGPADFCVEASSIFVCHLCLGKLAGAAFWESWAAAPPAETKAYLQMARSVRVPCTSNQSHGRQRPHSKLHNMMLFLLSCLFKGLRDPDMSFLQKSVGIVQCLPSAHVARAVRYLSSTCPTRCSLSGRNGNWRSRQDSIGLWHRDSIRDFKFWYICMVGPEQNCAQCIAYISL